MFNFLQIHISNWNFIFYHRFIYGSQCWNFGICINKILEASKHVIQCMNVKLSVIDFLITKMRTKSHYLRKKTINYNFISDISWRPGTRILAAGKAWPIPWILGNVSQNLSFTCVKQESKWLTKSYDITHWYMNCLRQNEAYMLYILQLKLFHIKQFLPQTFIPYVTTCTTPFHRKVSTYQQLWTTVKDFNLGCQGNSISS